MLRVRDVAERWSMDVETIYVMIRRGELEARRFSAKCIRVPIAAVEVHEQCQEKTEVPTSGKTQTPAFTTSAVTMPANAPLSLRVAATVQKLRRT